MRGPHNSTVSHSSTSQVCGHCLDFRLSPVLMLLTLTRASSGLGDTTNAPSAVISATNDPECIQSSMFLRFAPYTMINNTETYFMVLPTSLIPWATEIQLRKRSYCTAHPRLSPTQCGGQSTPFILNWEKFQGHIIQIQLRVQSSTKRYSWRARWGKNISRVIISPWL
jgi:hypothetical protein